MNEFTPWQYEALGERAVEALKRNRFEAEYCATKEEAAKKLLSLIPEGASVGFGGSWTVKALGVSETLAKGGHALYDHGVPGLTNEEKLDLRRKQLTCDVFLSGTNAVTLDGELVNVDGSGNRVAAMIFGPKRVVVVAGANKIVRDLAEAFDRIETKAAPLNNKRLGLKNPCTETGTCMDCQSATRICNVTTIIEKKPGGADFHVLVVGEELGF
ncbi:MAG TPA: lactate utilization protein C [Synergistaceae bacterium]|jgi:hypothetical protein|nr:lactate utilization protein C [Synergistaceae bacterium]